MKRRSPMKVEQEPTSGEKIEILVLTASDTNQKYLTCVPWFIEFWESMNNAHSSVVFKPLVLVISDSLPEELKKFEQNCKVITTQLPSTFVAQNIRSLYAGLADSDYVVTSDIDMLPLNNKVILAGLNKVIESKGTNSFAVLRDVLPQGQYAICYSLASPKTWREVFNLHSESDVMTKLSQQFSSINSMDYEGQHGGYGWFSDQEFLYETVQSASESSQISLIKLTDDETGHRRLDRVYHRGPLKWLALFFVRKGRYTDYHVHHPINNNIKYLNALLKRIRN